MCEVFWVKGGGDCVLCSIFILYDQCLFNRAAFKWVSVVSGEPASGIPVHTSGRQFICKLVCIPPLGNADSRRHDYGVDRSLFHKDALYADHAGATSDGSATAVDINAINTKSCRKKE